MVLLNLRVLLSLDPHDLVPAMAEVLQRDYRRVPSAIAVLGSTRPREHYRTRHLRGLEKDGAIAKPPAPTRRGGLRHPPRDDLIRALEALDALNREWGPAMGEEYPQLVVFHNPLAARRLRPSALPGVYDRHFKIVLDNDVGIILQRVLVPQRYIPR